MQLEGVVDCAPVQDESPLPGMSPNLIMKVGEMRERERERERVCCAERIISVLTKQTLYPYIIVINQYYSAILFEILLSSACTPVLLQIQT